MEARSRAYKVFRLWLAHAQRQSEEKLKIWQSDGAAEFRSKELQDYLAQKGIKHHISLPYAHQMQGIAERMNRTLMTKVQALMKQSMLPPTYWTHAMHHATTGTRVHVFCASPTNRIPATRPLTICQLSLSATVAPPTAAPASTCCLFCRLLLLDDLQLFLQCDSKDGLSLFDLTSGASTAPTANADSTVRSQWLTHDTATRLAVRNHLPSTERAHFSQYKSASALYDAVVARYSSPTTAALSRLMLPYPFPDLAAFSTVADLVAHLRTSDARYRAALTTTFLPTNPPPMYITLYYLVTRLSDSLSLVRDHFLSLCPTELTVDLLEGRLAAAEKSILAVGASRGDRRTPFFEGCSPVPLLPSVASAAAVASSPLSPLFPLSPCGEFLPPRCQRRSSGLSIL
ncbi:unnamed protein product [Closterium sp. NIES-53]